MKCNFLKKVDKSIIFDGEYMEIYIPKINFDKRISELSGEYLSTLGVFNFLVYPEGKESKEKAEMRSLSLAFKIKVGFKSFFPIKTKLANDSEVTDYLVFTLERGDVFCLSTEQAKSSMNTKELIFLIHGGNLPKGMKYKKVLDCYYDTCNLNGVNLKSQLSIFEYIVAELSRCKDNQAEPFRKLIGANNSTVSEYDFTLINLKKLPSLNSTFAALTFEDINQSIIYSLKKTKTGEEEKETPIEKVLKY